MSTSPGGNPLVVNQVDAPGGAKGASQAPRGVISLIGYRGCGKSTLAPLLARALGWDWIDADVELERRAGQTIREIFAAEGESGFRTRERNLLSELLQRERLVLAAGGGAILNPQTRQDMRDAGPTVWLRAPAETLYARITGDTTTAGRRPNLAGGGLTEVTELLARREPLYSETARLIVDIANHSPEELLAALLPELCRPQTFAKGDSADATAPKVITVATSSTAARNASGVSGS